MDDSALTRRPAGALDTVIFDWAGTIVDFGSFAPTQVLVDAFAEAGVAISLDEARGPMGLAKWDHIQALGRMPAVAARWRERHGRDMSREDVDTVYQTFMPLQVARVGHYSTLIPGALQVVEILRRRGMRIGSCSGYPRVVMDALVPLAAQAGYVPDCVIASDDLKAGGRPGPWMALANMLELGSRDVAACVKVDDTVPGIAEGLAAGMWTVGLSASGNEVGLSWEEWCALTPDERDARCRPAEDKLRAAGAHEVIRTVIDLPAALERIEVRRGCGERP
ncbi:MAG: phosphonoacetaldehyde hydrolase [Castellaniella sp.]|uniref:phosphonoacetaldehyde hydrolase n=1 Tax=Castellaniella sp. TaxID=1955812 RepID=UPI002A35973E|nr:phosphonoacetaldehyde hydrolase [Castellaniella sp.]MDY0308605.1 phosphonoacetaldehyde hydrolase [Castellaniella sp.]